MKPWTDDADARLKVEVARHPYPLAFATVSGAHLYGFTTVVSPRARRRSSELPDAGGERPAVPRVLVQPGGPVLLYQGEDGTPAAGFHLGRVIGMSR